MNPDNELLSTRAIGSHCNSRRSTNYCQMLVPPENFSMVEEGIYRSSKVDAINISFLKSIDLKAVVWINEEKPPRVVRQFMDESNIRLYHMVNSGVFPEEEENIKLHQEWMVLKPSLISKTIQTILDVDNHNCLIMDASEIIVGVLRCIERWNYSSISNEYRLFANRTSYKVEIFLEYLILVILHKRKKRPTIPNVKKLQWRKCKIQLSHIC